jgi:SAM-dependent methyltransferase
MSFGGIADDYDRLRPGPAPAALDWLLPARPDVVVDLGAGTGLLSRALAGRADRVIAVEPDARMRAVLTGRSPGVEVLAGRGESIPLPDASADAVLVSSAWHWMAPAAPRRRSPASSGVADGSESCGPGAIEPLPGCVPTNGSSVQTSPIRRGTGPSASVWSMTVATWPSRTRRFS